MGRLFYVPKRKGLQTVTEGKFGNARFEGNQRALVFAAFVAAAFLQLLVGGKANMWAVQEQWSELVSSAIKPSNPGSKLQFVG